jgi:hypothetical protein
VPTKKLDPKDFIFSQRQSELLERTQGHIAGQQFILEELTDCEVLLLDHSAQVPIRARVPMARARSVQASSIRPIGRFDCAYLVDLHQGRLWAVDRAEYKLAVGR